MDLSQTSVGPIVGPHIHITEARCPVCDQPIPNEKADQVQARLREWSEEQFAQERMRILEKVQRDNVTAIEKVREEERKAATIELQRQIDGLSRQKKIWKTRTRSTATRLDASSKRTRRSRGNLRSLRAS
jgi:DNA repair exonuclease SbcCD ATPase subunit